MTHGKGTRPLARMGGLLLLTIMPLARGQAPRPGNSRQADPVVLIVGGQRVRASELNAAVAGITAPPEREGMELHPVRAAQWYGRVVALAQAAERLKIHPANLPAAPSLARDEALASTLMEHLAHEAQPTSGQEEAFYRSHPSLFAEARASYILISDGNALESRSKRSPAEAEARIQRLTEQIKRGGNFAELALKYSDDAATRAKGGDLGFIQPHQMTPTFDRILWTLRSGETSAPFRTRFGWNIVHVEQRRLQPLGAVRGRIAGILRGQAMQARIKQAIARAHITPVRAALEKYCLFGGAGKPSANP